MAETIGVKVGTKTIDQPLTKILVYSGTNVEYIGEAAPGTATSEVKWRIQKITYNAMGLPLTIKWANGSADFDKEFDERTSYAYS